MNVRNLTAKSDDEFLTESIRCWREAFDRGDWEAFRYWAVHAFCFARTQNVNRKNMLEK